MIENILFLADAPYQLLDSVNATNDLSNLLVYANDLSGNVLMPGILFAFYVIVFLASTFGSIRFSGRARVPQSFAVAGFATFGLAALMSLKDGLVNGLEMTIVFVVFIAGVAYLFLKSD